MTNDEIVRALERGERTVLLNQRAHLMPELRNARQELYQAMNRVEDAKRALIPINNRLHWMKGAKIIRGVAIVPYHSSGENGHSFAFRSVGDDIYRSAEGFFIDNHWSVVLKRYGDGRNQRFMAPTQETAETMALDWVCETKLPERDIAL